jgi:predicted flap endonuclease-1-like 5' DNA nuclease
MIKKVIHAGLGIASIIVEKVSKLVHIGEKKLFEEEGAPPVKPAPEKAEMVEAVKPAVSLQIVEPPLPPQPVQPVTTAVVEAAVAQPPARYDDLTAIKGIGPTFARRLKEAGITSYVALAGASREQLQEITRAADWQANPEEWIAQAKALA